jgi:hypothetical protein
LDLEQWTTRPKRCTRFFRLFCFWPYDRNHSIIRTLTLKHKKHLLFLFKQKYLYNFFINLRFDIFCKRKKSFIHILQTSRNKKQQHLSFISYNISFRTCFHKFNSIFHRKLEKHFSFFFHRKIWLTCSPLSRVTCRLSCMSHLFPISIRSTSADAC